MEKLIISNLSVKLNNRKVLENISLNAKNGDLIAILGPNGAGKSSLLKAIFNHYSITSKKGKISFNNKNITNFKTSDIAQLGFFFCMQNPIELNGVKNLDLLKLVASHNNVSDFSSTFNSITKSLKELGLPNEILTREVNVNFSGGQKKKNEILQSMLFNPKVLLLDEIDSGLDIDAMKNISTYINKQRLKSIILIVTHHLEFLKFIKPTKVIILINGKKVKEGKQDIIKLVENKGFEPFQSKQTKNLDEFSKVDPFVCSTQI
jgi:Fe-S cluster assembly ATP-binding protein